MRRELYESARRWAHAGFDAYQHDHGKQFAVMHAAVALEHLAKSYLCSVHPALIADRGDFKSLLHLVGQSKKAGVPRQQIRTIGLAEACERVKHLLKAFPFDGRANDLVVQLRNGVAHAGLLREADVREALTLAVRRIDLILSALGRQRSQFWGQFADLTEMLVDQAVQDVTLRVQMKLRRAHDTYAERLAGLPQDVRQTVISALAAQAPVVVDEDQHTTVCPACGEQAWLGGTTETRWDETPHGTTSAPMVVMYPNKLRCPACKLDLNDADELRQANIGELIELRDAEPDLPESDLDLLARYVNDDGHGYVEDGDYGQ